LLIANGWFEEMTVVVNPFFHVESSCCCDEVGPRSALAWYRVVSLCACTRRCVERPQSRRDRSIGSGENGAARYLAP